MIYSNAEKKTQVYFVYFHKLSTYTMEIQSHISHSWTSYKYIKEKNQNELCGIRVALKVINMNSWRYTRIIYIYKYTYMGQDTDVRIFQLGTLKEMTCQYIQF